MRLLLAVVLAVLAAPAPAHAGGESASSTYVGAGPVVCTPAGVSHAGGCFDVPAGAASVNIDVVDLLGQRLLSEFAFYAQPPDPLTGLPTGEPVLAEQFCGEAYQIAVPSGVRSLVVRVKLINEDDGVMTCPVLSTTGEISVEFRVP